MSNHSNQVGINFHHQQVTVEDIQLHTVSVGQAHKQAVLFLHGFPQNWLAFEQVMAALGNTYYALAIDLPGIGQSGKIAANDPLTIAHYVNGLIKTLKLQNPILVGHDMGGMVTYAYLHAYPGQLAKAVIMNVAVPGVDPWPQIKQNPHIWHFTFHTIPNLPETLVAGKQREYFDFFFDTLAIKPDRIDDQARAAYVEAYSSADSLHTGFEWYRAFEQAEQENTRTKKEAVSTPVLYLRGAGEYGKLEDYLKGFRESGLVNVQGELVPDSGHYAPEEASKAVVDLLKAFIQ